MTKINLFTTCVNYTDFLKATIEYNLPIFDKIYLATSDSDTVTQEYCKQYNKIHVEITNAFYDIPNYFNKGKALNQVLKYAEKNTWNLIGDVDCIYPSNLVDLLSNISEDKIDNLFSFRRIICETKDKLQYVKNLATTYHAHPRIKNESPFNGYCQIFNSSSRFLKGNIKYNEDPAPPTKNNRRFIPNCKDQSFKNLWPLRNRTLLEGLVIHLGPPIINWQGRKSPEW